MSRTHPHDIIKELRNTSGKNDKLAVLKREAGNMLWKEVCHMTLDPFTNFGMSHCPTVKKFAKLTDLQDLGSSLVQIRNILCKQKLRGHAARDWMISLLEHLDERGAYVICRIIAKDLDCGVDTAVNKVWSNFIEEIPQMLCEKEGNAEDFDIAQLKEDGMRLFHVVEGDSVTHFSRSGRAYDFHGRFDKMFVKMAGGKNVVFDGEGLIMLPDGKWMPRKAGNGIIKKAGLKGISAEELDGLRFALWDVIALDAWRKGYSAVTYAHRLEQLQKAIFDAKSNNLVSIVPTTYYKTPAQAQALFDEYVAKGFEGLILKQSSGPWENDRVSHQVKMKSEREADLEITGTVPHTKNSKLIGALEMRTACGKLTVNVGSGLDDEIRAMKPSELIGKIGAIVFNELIQDSKGNWSMFLPRLAEIRADKKKANTLKELQ